MSNIVIHDTNPALTTFVSAGMARCPTASTGAIFTAPGAGEARAIRWTFNGSLAPAGSGTVSFTTHVDQ